MASTRGGPGAAWESWLGIVAIVLGVLLGAAQATEWTKQAVIWNATPADGVLPLPDCPEDELLEEGLSVAECEQLVSNVRSFVVSAPEWFPGLQAALAAAGTVLALVSIIVGAALVDHRGWAPAAAVSVFGALALLDAAGFVSALGTGPILRDIYLWNFLLWFFIHLMMTMGALAGRAAPAAASG